VFGSVDEVNSNHRILTKSGTFEGTVVVGVDDTTMQITPGCYCGLLVPEPFCCGFTEIVSSHVGNSGCDLIAGDQSVEVSQLFGVSEGNECRIVELEHIIEIFISSTEHFRLVDLNYK